MNTRITSLDASAFRDYLPEALAVYVAAMEYPALVMRSRAPAWAEHSSRRGWACTAALEEQRCFVRPKRPPQLVGVCYGYRGAPGQWWFNEVDRGLRERTGAGLRPDYVELTELHVAPAHQGKGLGKQLLQQFLDGRSEPRVMLSTPEVLGENNGAWRLYRSLGFTDVLRGFHFTGDQRPFAVLARDLPLDVTESAATAALKDRELS